MKNVNPGTSDDPPANPGTYLPFVVSPSNHARDAGSGLSSRPSTGSGRTGASWVSAPSAVERVRFEQVRTRFPGPNGGSVEALAGIDLAIGAGELVAIVGPSGCGKTTLLRHAAGLLPPSEGRVLVDGQVVREPLPSMGFVFQHPALLEWRTVLDNVLLPAELQPAAERRDAREAAERLLRLVGLEEFALARPRQLSGGMQQRVALARALLLDPTLLLLDEPFGALDAISREELQGVLLQAWSASRATALFVTHDLAEAVFLADRVVLLTPRPGRIAHIARVPLPRPRVTDHRFDAAYVATCRDLRRVLDAGRAAAVLRP